MMIIGVGYWKFVDRVTIRKNEKEKEWLWYNGCAVGVRRYNFLLVFLVYNNVSF